MSDNIYQKLQKARVELQDMKLKKTGKNTYSNFTYFELSDFLPAVNALNLKHGLFTKFNIIDSKDGELAVLSVINIQDPTEKIDFHTKTAEVEIGKKKDGTGGADPIQNLGGKRTYLRRYLFVSAYEIEESEIVDRVNMELTDELDQKDIDKINNAGDFKELTTICGNLKSKYKVELITPLFETRKVELEQQEAK